MTTRRRATAVVALGIAPLVFSTLLITAASAHGTMQTPASRIYACYLEGPEAPQSAACQAAIALGGSAAVYDWNEVNIPDAAGRHRQIIPDGQLCSAGRSKYAGFDLPRADWPATALPTGGSYTFRYRATAPHRGSFELYLTRDGYQPTQPLRWSDLEPAPFLRVTDPPISGGAYVMSGQLPSGKTGRHLLYSIWQRSDSPEAFYTCSDVVFGGPGPTPSPSTSPSAPPSTPPPSSSPAPTTSAPPGAYPLWQSYTAYAVGDRVSYGGRTYQCRQSHTALPGWEPPNVLALWSPL